MATAQTRAKRRPQKFPLKVIKGGFAPADRSAAARMRERGYRVGDLVFAQLTKPRNPRFWGLAHAFGALLAQNIDEFQGMDAHKALKRIQLEAGIACDEVAYRIPGYGMVVQKVPQSLSFESMEDGEFREVFRGFCRHVAETYWTDCTEDQIAAMAEVMVGEE